MEKKLIQNYHFLNMLFKFVYEKICLSVYRSGSKIYLKRNDSIFTYLPRINVDKLKILEKNELIKQV